MLSDEEKKAIDKISKLVEYLRKWNENFTIVSEDAKYFEKILDMTKTHLRMIDENIEEILEQQKEIEELKNKNKKLQDKAKELIFEKQQLSSALLDSTPDDKIKAKIEELDYNDIGNFERRCKQEVLQSLLEKEGE